MMYSGWKSEKWDSGGWPGGGIMTSLRGCGEQKGKKDVFFLLVFCFSRSLGILTHVEDVWMGCVGVR